MSTLTNVLGRGRAGDGFVCATLWLVALSQPGCGGTQRRTAAPVPAAPSHAIHARGAKIVAGTGDGLCEFLPEGPLVMVLTAGCATVAPLDVMVHEYAGETRTSAKPLVPSPAIVLPKEQEQHVALALPRLGDHTTNLKLEVQSRCDGEPGYALGTYRCRMP